jgi:hypothetical protein
MSLENDLERPFPNSNLGMTSYAPTANHIRPIYPGMK